MKLKLQMQWRLTLVAILLAAAAFVQAQTRTITGSVLDASNNTPVIGANILVKGTSKGTVTNVDGNFELSVSPADQSLIITYIGYLPKEVSIGSASTLNIALEEDAIGLTEVTVTALGISKEKSRVGYAVQDVKGSDLIKAREPNPINSLTGKVAGLTVGASAELLGAPAVYLRGERPLYVVDGVPIQSDTWNINPDDIETMTVLKGPAASALYGSRGQNGAIQITTKRGASDKRGFAIEFNSSFMVESSFLTIPKVQDEYGPGDHGRYAFADGRGGGLYDSDYDVWGPKFEGQMIPQYDGKFNANQKYTTTFPSGATFTGNIEPTPWVARGKDNLTRFLRPGLLNNNNLAISASGDRYDLRISGSYNYQQGLVPNTQLHTGNLNLNTGIKISDRIRFDANLNYGRQMTDNIPDVVYGPNSLIYNMIIWGGADWDVDQMKNYWQEGKEGIQQIYADYTRYNNPWFAAQEWLRGHQKTDIYGYAAVTFNLAKGLDVKARTQVTGYDITRTEKFPYSATTYGREQARGDYREDLRNLFENNTDVLVSFGRQLTPAFELNASAGANLRTFNYSSTYASTDYLNVPGWYNLNNSLNQRQVFNYGANMAVSSLYGFADLSYKRFLNLSLTGRVDKNSTLPADQNTYFYPSASLSFILSEVVELPSAISFLKLRASYANVGGGLTSAQIAPAYLAVGRDIIGYGTDYYTPFDGPSYRNSAGYELSFPYNNEPAARFPNTIVNPNLEPSFSAASEFGIDLRLFKNRLGLDVTYFNSLDGPGIFNLPLSQAAGYNSAVENGITTKKTGWEVVANVKPVVRSNFNWETQINWSTFKEVLEEVYPGVENLTQFIKVGDRIDGFYSGAFHKTQDGQLINDAGGRPFALPQAQFLGFLNPDWTWGINNRLAYKNWSANFQFDGRVGGVIANYIQRQTFRGGRHIATTEGAMGEARYQDYLGKKTWIGTGVTIANGAAIKYNADGSIANYDELEFKPNTTATFLQDYISRYYAQSEANLMSRSFAKLREVTVSYNVPASVFQSRTIRAASISLVGRNLLYFAEKKDLDLDQFVEPNGSSDLQSPTMRRFGINLNLTF